ncbi:metalloregulator ArsR/SmtB family transcription factor [Streptomyces sp. JNUCC 64]
MDALLAALADPARWRLVTLLAERPRPVGVLARLAGARQPQTTKHLQTLERAGVVTSERSGQRRVYALVSAPLRELAAALGGLADTVDRSGGSHATFDRYGLGLRTERAAALEAGWADGRVFAFSRSLAADPARVWRQLTETALLAAWWTPDDLRVSELAFEARPGGRIVQEYRDVEDVDGHDRVVGRAEGTVEEARPGERLGYRLSPLLADGTPAFTAHVTFDLRPHGTAADDGTGSGGGTPAGPVTDLVVDFRVTDSTVESADFVAGVEIGFGQSLDRLVAVLADGIHHGTEAAEDADGTGAGTHHGAQNATRPTLTAEGTPGTGRSADPRSTG